MLGNLNARRWMVYCSPYATYVPIVSCLLLYVWVQENGYSYFVRCHTNTVAMAQSFFCLLSKTLLLLLMTLIICSRQMWPWQIMSQNSLAVLPPPRRQALNIRWSWGLTEPRLASESCRWLKRFWKWCHLYFNPPQWILWSLSQSCEQGCFLWQWGSPLVDPKGWECCSWFGSFTQLGQNSVSSPVLSGSIKNWFCLLKAS